MMKVLAGDWKSNEYAVFQTTFLGKTTSLLMPTGLISKEKLELSSILSAEIVTDSDSLFRRAGWAALGAVALGPLGLLAGVVAGKKTIVAVEFKDGRKALLECGSGEVATLKAACF